jgi:integrase
LIGCADFYLSAAGLVAVRGSLQPDASGRRIVTEPKTQRSRRQVRLTGMAVEALTRHRAAQAAERLQGGAAWEDRGLVFSNTVGRPITDANLRHRSFYPLLERADLPRIRFHDLRHSAATLLLGEGIHPKIVSDLLGHSRIGITLDLYSHVTDTMQQQAVRALEGLFGSQVGSRVAPRERKTAGERP